MSPTGIEPVFSAPEANVLSVELRGRVDNVGWLCLRLLNIDFLFAGNDLLFFCVFVTLL